ncbi:MAG TPA: GNAT family N-acetyltransferase [Ideonella sp.]|nr:GNAT family N-acetyltransferase [Ideonella sp.]
MPEPQTANLAAALASASAYASTNQLLVRPSTDADLPAIAAIYGEAVLHGTGTFELEVPDQADMARRRQDVLSKDLPWLVAESAGQVLGYAYANHFRPRRAYRFCVEDSIYLHPDARGRGVGTALLAELIARCTAAGARQMLAVIGDSANHGSIGVHRRHGFQHTGLLKSAGWKFDRWLDVVLMQLALGEGDGTAALDLPGPPL